MYRTVTSFLPDVVLYYLSKSAANTVKAGRVLAAKMGYWRLISLTESPSFRTSTATTTLGVTVLPFLVVASSMREMQFFAGRIHNPLGALKWVAEEISFSDVCSTLPVVNPKKSPILNGKVLRKTSLSPIVSVLRWRALFV